MKEILSINVVIDGAYDVNSMDESACMIPFHGESRCDNFTGIILPGGVDTQRQKSGGVRTLSARYILEGTDCAGEHCRIFIENNGSFEKDGSIITKPQIITDSKELGWMMAADLTVTVTGTETGVNVSIFIK